MLSSATTPAGAAIVAGLAEDGVVIAPTAAAPTAWDGVIAWGASVFRSWGWLAPAAGGAAAGIAQEDPDLPEQLGDAVCKFSGEAPSIGDTIFRVFGGDARAPGGSWTPINPETVDNFRQVAGLPDVNSGRWMISGTIQSIPPGTIWRPALPFDGNPGGLPEIWFPGGGGNVIPNGGPWPENF